MAKKKYLHLDDQDEKNVKRNALTDTDSFFYLLKYVKPRKYKFFFNIFVLLCSSILLIVSARLIAELIEKGLKYSDYKEITFWALLIIFFEITFLFVNLITRRTLAKHAAETILDIRNDLFAHIQKLPIAFYDRQPQGRIITRLTHDVEGLENFFTNSLGRMLNAFFMTIVAASAMLISNWKLGTIIVIAMLPCVLFIHFTKSQVKKVNRRMSKNSSQANSTLNEFISGIDVIRSYGLEEWSEQKYKEKVDKHMNSQLQANFLYAWSRPLISLLCVLPMIGLVWFGGKEIILGSLSIGLFVSFIRYTERFYNPVLIIAREFQIIQQAFTSAERIASFLKEKEEDDSLGPNGIIDGINQSLEINGHIEFKNLWMSYDKEDWILKNLNFKILPGQKVGLVGRTGCGKSTSVALLSRLYEFQKGDILIDAQGIRRFHRSYLRNQIGFVAQDPIIFTGSLKENLCAGYDYSIEHLNQCIEITGLNNIMKNSNLTLESSILDNGANLSTGEKQLIALTRVLLKNPRILILDEATANIDPEFEEIIHNAVQKIMLGRTCLIIAHRLSTIMECDNVLVFDNGSLVEEGSARELLTRNGKFSQLQTASELNFN